MIFTKEMIGKEIYAIPTGNNARGAVDKIVTFKVMSVGRVYVGLSFVYSNSIGDETKYHPQSGATQKAINSGYAGSSGYKFFESLDELADYRNMLELRDSFDKKLRNIRSSQLNKSQLERMNEILNEVSQ